VAVRRTAGAPARKEARKDRIPDRSGPVYPQAMRTRRLLLATTALSTAALLQACSKKEVIEPIPGNPKGSMYDAGQVEESSTSPEGSSDDAKLAQGPGGAANAAPDAGPAANDASATDAGASGAGATGAGATGASATDAGKSDAAAPPPPDLTAKPLPTVRPLPGNPKGSRYDKGLSDPFAKPPTKTPAQ
jgi:hypothetical protein